MTWAHLPVALPVFLEVSHGHEAHSRLLSALLQAPPPTLAAMPGVTVTCVSGTLADFDINAATVYRGVPVFPLVWYTLKALREGTFNTAPPVVPFEQTALPLPPPLVERAAEGGKEAEESDGDEDMEPAPPAVPVVAPVGNYFPPAGVDWAAELRALLVSEFLGKVCMCARFLCSLLACLMFSRMLRCVVDPMF